MTMTMTGYVGEVLGLRSSDIWMAVNQSETFNYRLEKKKNTNTIHTFIEIYSTHKMEKRRHINRRLMDSYMFILYYT